MGSMNGQTENTINLNGVKYYKVLYLAEKIGFTTYGINKAISNCGVKVLRHDSRYAEIYGSSDKRTRYINLDDLKKLAEYFKESVYTRENYANEIKQLDDFIASESPFTMDEIQSAKDTAENAEASVDLDADEKEESAQENDDAVAVDPHCSDSECYNFDVSDILKKAIDTVVNLESEYKTKIRHLRYDLILAQCKFQQKQNEINQKSEDLGRCRMELATVKDENERLKKKLSILAEDRLDMDYKSVLKQIVEEYAKTVYGKTYEYNSETAYDMALSVFIRAFDNVNKVNLFSRRGFKDKSLLDYVRDNKEWTKLMATAVSICENKGVDISNIVASINRMEEPQNKVTFVDYGGAVVAANSGGGVYA